VKHVTQDIYIGVDGGATKCKVRIEDSRGNLLGQAIGGPANIRLSVDASWQSIYQTIEEVLKTHNISLRDKQYHFHAGLGLAGCEVQEAREAFLATPHPFVTLHLISDAHVACIGAHGGDEGAIIIIGTGVIGYQIQNGVGSKVGGWGFPHDDMGGGAWLGLEAARLTFQWLDHRVEKSPLSEDVFAYFENDLNRFVTWANRATSNDFAKLAPLVINHSQQGEMESIRLMKKAAHAVDRIGVALEKIQLNKKQTLRCSLFGGIAPFIEAYLSDELRARIVQREGDANRGAILLSKQTVLFHS
jgi:glucosamine kinase